MNWERKIMHMKCVVMNCGTNPVFHTSHPAHPLDEAVLIMATQGKNSLSALFVASLASVNAFSASMQSISRVSACLAGRAPSVRLQEKDAPAAIDVPHIF